MSEMKFPTEVIELPSKGLLYPKTSPLSSGKVEIKYELEPKRSLSPEIFKEFVERVKYEKLQREKVMN